MATRWMCLFFIGAPAWACSGSSDGDSGDACPPPSQKYPLREGYAEHACLHVVNGPYETHAAESSTSSTKTELRNTHYAYTVELPASADARTGDARTGAVYFEPRSTEGFAFFRDSDAPFTVQARDGTRICPVASYEVKASCPELRRVDFFDLARKSEYPLIFGPTPASKVMVIIEAAP